MSDLLAALSERVLLCDGAMGSRVQALDLDVERDFRGKENCTEVLNLSRPDIVRGIHESYFAAGSDMVETNSFGGSPLTPGGSTLRPNRAEAVQPQTRRAASRAGTRAIG